jgi:hypothetical protein
VAGRERVRRTAGQRHEATESTPNPITPVSPEIGAAGLFDSPPSHDCRINVARGLVGVNEA